MMSVLASQLSFVIPTMRMKVASLPAARLRDDDSDIPTFDAAADSFTEVAFTRLVVDPLFVLLDHHLLESVQALK